MRSLSEISRWTARFERLAVRCSTGCSGFASLSAESPALLSAPGLDAGLCEARLDGLTLPEVLGLFSML